MNNKFLKSALIFGIILIVGIFLLNIAGRFLIQEVTQDIFISEQADKSIGINIGKKAPYFELVDLVGGHVNLSELSGEPLIIVFWSSWNPIAADQIKILDDYLSSNKDELFKIITINNQEKRSTVLNFLRRGGYSVQVLLDETGSIGEQYKIKNLPTTFFINQNGVVRDIFIGPMSEKILLEKVEILFR